MLVKMPLFISSIVSVLLVLGFPFIMTEVVNSFSTCKELLFFNEKHPHIQQASCSEGEGNLKKICQKYKDKYRFATLYDTMHRIPVFSAYRYTRTRALNGQDIFPAMVEPQLDPSNDEMGVEYENQATTRDFLERNHVYLFPSSRAADNETAESTFTLTNSVPLDDLLHVSTWNNMENENKQLMDNHCRDKHNTDEVLAYVVTGALPNTTDRRKIEPPTHIWTAFCCYDITQNKWVSKAQWVRNEDGNLRDFRGGLNNITVFLQERFNPKLQLFDNDCNEKWWQRIWDYLTRCFHG